MGRDRALLACGGSLLIGRSIMDYLDCGARRLDATFGPARIPMSVGENGLPFGKPVGTGSEPCNFETPQSVLAHGEFVKGAFHRGLER